MIEAGKLKHRITIQKQVRKKGLAGAPVISWEDLHVDIAASIEPLSAREYINSQAFQSKVTARIVIRFIPDLDSSMRIVHVNKRFNTTSIYNIEGILSDKDSGIEYLTIPVSKDVNNG